MPASDSRFWFWLLLVFTAVTGLWQVTQTELLPDEAYYWLYAQNLDWGYFDHPPMVALLIKLSCCLGHSEFGVRAVFLVFSLAALVLVHRVVKPKDELLFTAVFFSLPLLHLGSGFAAPDIPLVFFGAAFFAVYQRFLAKNDWASVVVLTFLTTAMLYTKYHTVLVLFFCIAANVNVLTNKKFWAAVIASTILFLPHVYWQWQHGFPSVVYHLSGRNDVPWQLWYTTNYIAGQWLVLGPFICLPVLYFATRTKFDDKWLTAIKWNVIGFLLFFLYNSFRNTVEANWTAPILIPFAILSYTVLQHRLSLRKWVVGTAVLSFCIIFLIKAVLILPAFDEIVTQRTELKGWKKLATAVLQVSGDKPVVFMNSYRMAATYAFYSGGLTTSVNTAAQRGNQFDYWGYGEQMAGKEVLEITNDWYYSSDPKIATPRINFSYRWAKNHKSYYRFRVKSVDNPMPLEGADSISLNILIEEKFSSKKLLYEYLQTGVPLYFQYAQPKNHRAPIYSGVTITSNTLNTVLPMKIPAPPPSGTYELYFIAGNATNELCAVNSSKIIVKNIIK